MHRVLTIIGLTAAAVLIGASATMNFVFASSLGKTQLEGTVLGVVSVAIDVLKALLAVFIAAAARAGRRSFVVIGGFAFLLFFAASLLSATGFTSINRGAVADSRSLTARQLAAAERDLARSEAKLAALPSHRAASLVEEALVAAAAMDANSRTSKSCTSPTTLRQREFCLGQSVLRSELAAAREATRLEALILQQRAHIDVLGREGGGQVADPQARLLAHTFGIDEGHVQRLLMVMIALVVEVASGLGIYLATGHRQDRSGGSEPVAGQDRSEPVLQPSDPNPVMVPMRSSPVSQVPADVVIEAQAIDPDRRAARARATIGITVARHDSG